jgi:hypothetical protein
MKRTDSDRSMETVHLSEEPINDYEESTVQLQPVPSKEIVPRASSRASIPQAFRTPLQLAGILFC